ncbi:MAG: NAD(P)/FAD-dependent oxidoreductase [Actinobacteria bacterium]|nr:NAD(P)/FAD-dependent oxidoreductase [Actinomycetota bacterium]
MTERRILVVGAGFAGLYAAMRLRRAVDLGHRVTVVNPENFMQYQPFLPEVASGTIDPRAVVVPLRRVLRHCEIVIGEAERVDHAARSASVRLPDGRRSSLDYDVVVLAAGSWARVLPIPGLAEHAVGFKTVQEAIWLRNRVLSRLDLAEATNDPERRRAALTFVFVGGGYAGVEALGELEDLARDAVGSYPGLRRSELRWILVEAAGQILPELGPALADYARERLQERGIEVLLRTRLDSAEHGVIRLSDGQAFPADTLVWTAGVKPSPLAAASGFPMDDDGRVRTDVYLRVEGVEDAWAAGDAAAVPEPGTGGTMPPTAQHGMRQGKHLGRNVLADLGGTRLEPFDYRGIGSVCSLGRYKGVATIFGVRLRGFPAWFAHRSYHLFAMPTITRKVKIAADWTVALLFPRDLAQLGSLEHPREPFERAAGSSPADPS